MRDLGNAVRLLGALGALAWLGGCGDNPPTAPESSGVPGFAVMASDPVAGLSVMTPGTHAGANADLGSSVTYVSIAPGTLIAESSIEIRNLTSGFTRTELSMDGGLDPVPVPATAGDELELTATHGSRVTGRVVVKVTPRTRPKVVRVDPPRGKRDVALNARLVIVFSEPIDATTITTQSIRVLRAGSLVMGSIEQSDDGLRVVFSPDGWLAADTEYQLAVGTPLADLTGDVLEAPMTTGFRTGSSAPEPVSLVIAPDPLLSVLDNTGSWGYDVTLRATMRDAAGNELPYAGLVQWQSSDGQVVAWRGEPGVADYSGHAEIMASVRGVGSATITAAAAGLTGSTTVVIENASFEAVSVGVNYLTCYLTAAGAAYCRGANDRGQLGIGDGSPRIAFIPVGVAPALSFRTISPGLTHICALTSGGAAHCWGDNSHGQLGDGTSIALRSAPVQVTAGGLAFTQIGSGWTHTCALSAVGQAYCWGAYGWATVDSITTDPTARLGPVPTPVPGNLTFMQLTVGGEHACGLDVDGAAYCWGMNGDVTSGGQLGDGSVTRTFSPVPVIGAHRFRAIAGGANHTCGATTTGDVYCWGGNGAGLAETGAVTAPMRVDMPAGVVLTEITAGQMLTCGLTADGAAYCWGWAWPCSWCGDVVLSPRRIGTLTFKSLDAGEADRVCGVTTQSEVYCWRASDLLTASALIGNGARHVQSAGSPDD